MVCGRNELPPHLDRTVVSNDIGHFLAGQRSRGLLLLLRLLRWRYLRCRLVAFRHVDYLKKELYRNLFCDDSEAKAAY